MHTDRHTNIQTYRHTDIHTDIQTDRHTYTYRQTDIQTSRQTDIQTDRHTDIHRDRHTNIQTYRPTYRQTDIQTCRQTDIQTYIHTHQCPLGYCLHILLSTIQKQLVPRIPAIWTEPPRNSVSSLVEIQSSWGVPVGEGYCSHILWVDRTNKVWEHLYVYIYIFTHIYTVYIYIYIYLLISVYIYIYISTFKYSIIHLILQDVIRCNAMELLI